MLEESLSAWCLGPFQQQNRSNPMKTSTKDRSAATDEKSKTERVYQELRRRIRELNLPPGTRLRKNQIADEFSVSRAPVSEAIARLAEEGLVDVYPQSGSFVSPIRPQDIHESMMIRTALEVEAIRRATELADDDLLARLEKNLADQTAALKKSDMARLDDLDEAFHADILQILNAPRMQILLDACRARLDRPRFQALPVDERPDATVREHRRILDAIKSGDVEFASAAMRVHLRMVGEAIGLETMQMDKLNEPDKAT